MIRVFIPERLVKIQSQNQGRHDHWSRAARHRKRWAQVLRIHLRGMIPAAPWVKAWCRITRIYGGRSRDFDFGNLVGGAKPVPDALIELGVIADDNPRQFACEYVQRKAMPGEECGTMIEMEATA